MATIGNLFVNVIAKTRGLASGLKGAKGMLGKFAKFAASPAGLAVAAFTALTVAIVKTTQALKSAIQESMKFNHAMSEVRMIMHDTSVEGAENFERLRQKAIELGKATVFTGSEVAQGMAMLQRAGFSVDETMVGIEHVLNLAAASSMEMGEAANITAGMIRAFGLDASEAGRVVDVLGITAARSKTTVQDMGEALKYVAPIAHSLGLTIEDVAMMIGILADNNIEGSMTGTSMRTMLIELIDEIHQRGMPALREYFDAQHNIVEIQDRFTKRAINTVDVLTKQTGAMDKLRKKIDASKDAMQQMAEERLNDLTGDTIKLSSAWSAFQVTVGDTFTESLRNLTQAFTSFINGLMAAYIAMFGRNEEAIMGVNTLKNVFIAVGVVILTIASIIKLVYNSIAFVVNTIKFAILAAVSIVAGAIGGLVVLIVKGLNALGLVSDQTEKNFTSGFSSLMETLGGETLTAGLDAGNNIVEGVAAGIGVSGAMGADAMYDAMYPAGEKGAEGIADGIKDTLPEKLELTIEEMEKLRWEALGEKGQKAFSALEEKVTDFARNWREQNMTESMKLYTRAIEENEGKLTDAMMASLNASLEAGESWEKAMDLQKRGMTLIDKGKKHWESFLTPVEKYNNALEEIDAVSEQFGLTQQERLDMMAGAMSDVLKQGDALTKSLRTPLEQFKDDMEEIQQLFEVGAISTETHARAMERLRQEARESGDIELLAHVVVDSPEIQKGFVTGLQTALGTVKVAGQVNKAEQIAQNNLEVQRNMQTLTDAIKTGVNSTADSLKGTVNTDVNGLEEAVTSGVSNATVTAHMETNVLEDLQKEANAISDEGFSSVVSALEDIKGEMSNSGNALT